MQSTIHDPPSTFLQVSPSLAAGRSLGLHGAHQVANASLALALARALPERWRPDAEAEAEGLAAARIAGRFDRRGRWLFDVAHNPDGMRALVAAMRAEGLPRPVVAVVGVLKDKAWPEMLEILRPAVDEVILTSPPSAPPDRRWDRAEVEFDDALARARRAGGTALVTGSFHTVGDAMARLPGFSPLG